MRALLRFLPLVLLALSGLVCSAGDGISNGFLAAVAQAEVPVAGKVYYARHCFMHEGGKHITTNYWRGTLVPINTRITVVASTVDKLILRVESTGETVTVDNIKNFTKCDMHTIARRMLTATPVSLDSSDEAMANAIKAGLMRLGMTKEQVLMARGFPPAHKTPSLDSDRWQYWMNRYGVQTIVFAQGKLVEGRGIN